MLSALNVGARLGVRGAPLMVPQDAVGQARVLNELRDMNVRLVDAADAPLEVRGRDHPWVSRGGIKLAHAIEHFGLDPAGAVAMTMVGSVV